MIRQGDDVPDVTAQAATGGDEHADFSLQGALDEGPVVLAFFPLAFSSVCTTQVRNIQENWYDDLRELDAQVYGVSVDSPFALAEFHESEGLSYPLVSDFNREIVETFALSTDVVGFEDVARRAAFVIDQEGTVVYADVLDDASETPDMEPVREAVAELSRQ
jgi:peroxiredoxin